MNKNFKIKSLEVDKPLKLDCGQTINNYTFAYETYGSLNKEKDNAILVFFLIFFIISFTEILKLISFANTTFAPTIFE